MRQRSSLLVVLLVLALTGCMKRSYPPTPTKTPQSPRAATTAAPAIILATAAPTLKIDTPVPTAATTDTPAPPPSTPGTPTVTSVPPTVDPNLPPEHYYLIRPIQRGWVDYADPTYAYGSTQGGTRRPHTGDDFVNPETTPVVANGNASIYYAGPDLDVAYGPNTAFYGNLIVLQYTDFNENGQPVYGLYGHLSKVLVETGQSVGVGDVIGEVGSTGVAIGPHLHFEVRVGDPTSYMTSTRNPALWIKPYYGYGTLAGKAINASGAYLRNVALTVKGVDTTRYAWSYGGDENIPDDNWKENFVLGDLPEGWYTVTTRGGSTIFSAEVYIRKGHTTWLEVQLP